MLPDYHIHTKLCKHAEGDVSEYRAVALKRGIPEICFTDHMPSPDGYDIPHRMEMSQVQSYKSMITSMQDGSMPEVLFGIEADFYEGCEIFLRQWLPLQNFDYVLGSVHYIQGWGFDNPSERHIWDSVNVTGTWQTYFDLIERLANLRLFDAVSHFDLPKKFGHRPSDNDLKEMAKPVLDCIARNDMGLELNTSGLKKPVSEIYPSPLILSLAFEREIPICFGSDAHRPDEVGNNFDQALKLARETGYTHYFKINQRKKELTPLPETLSLHLW